MIFSIYINVIIVFERRRNYLYLDELVMGFKYLYKKREYC